MIDTSTELFNAFLEDTRQIKVRVTIGNRVFDNDNIATLSLEYGSMDGGSLDIGGAFANSLKIGFSELVEGLKELDEIKVELGAVLPNETIEYVKMGTFIINEEVVMDRNNNTTSIDAMDRMVMLGETYESTLEGDYARIIDIAVDIANQAGVIVSSDFDRLRTDSILIPREKTLREAIGIIAQFEVGFAIFNRDGELTIRGLKDADFHVSPEEYTMKGLVKNEVPFRLNGVQCTTGDGEDDVLTSGGTRGNQIYLQNESMTQEHLNRIHQSLTSLNYYPFTLDWYGHPALEAGDWIEIEDLQGNKFKTPNLHYTLDFNGGLKAKSQAETTSSSEVVYQYRSPLKQEIQAIAARLSASSGNHVYDDLSDPENPKEGDIWFKPNGPDTLILIYERLDDGTLDWVQKIDTGDTTKNADAIAEQQQDIEEAKQIADEAVGKIDTAVANAGFTSLDDTLQSMNYITMNAEQNAQQAITNASNAYGLAQTSISEAQTAQANSLTALGKADNALDGVSDLDIRVDDVEAELELKADNTFMTEDGTLTTLSNAITFNAHRFSSDMSRIESRVESLAGEINLVILRDAFKNAYIEIGDTHPNPSPTTAMAEVMRDLIQVTPDEELYLSKETVSGQNFWRIAFYNSSGEFLTRVSPTENEYILTVPANATSMWVSYPTDSKPQITRGSEFIPYRPNLSDQMTTDEMVIFRNEYDEFADRSERRLSAIDGTGGRLETSEALLTQTAEGLKAKADQTTVNELTGEINSIGTLAETTAGRINNKVWNTDIETAIDDLEIGGSNLIPFSKDIDDWATWLANTKVEKMPSGVYRISRLVWATTSTIGVSSSPSFSLKAGNTYTLSYKALTYFGALPNYVYILSSSQGNTRLNEAEIRDVGLSEVEVVPGTYARQYKLTFTASKDITDGRVLFGYANDTDIPNNAGFYLAEPQLENGNVMSAYSPAISDTEEVVSHIQTEWTQTFEDFETTVSDNQGKVNKQLQTIENSLSAINDPVTGRLTVAEQTLNGFRNEVYNQDGSSKITQLATGVNSFVTNLRNKVNLIPSWEIGGISFQNGQDVDYQPDRMRTPLIKKRSQGTLFVSFSLDGVAINPSYIMRYRQDGSFYDFFQGRSTVTLTDTIPYCRIVVSGTDTNRKYQAEEGSTVSEYVPYISDVSQAQISQLADNINLRVTKGDVTSQINIEAGRTLIQSKKLLLDASNVVFTGKAWIPSSVIGDLEADKITSGKLDAGKITVVNLDADSITSNKTTFVQSGWNAINSRADMDANRLKFTHADGSSTQIGVNGLERVESDATRPYQYRTYVGSSNVSGELLDSGITINLPSDFKGKPFQVVVSLRGWTGGSRDGVRYNPTLIRASVDSVNRSNGSFVVKGSASGFNSKHEFHWVMDSATGTARKLVQVANLSVGDVSGPFGQGVDVYLAYTAIY